MDANEMADMDAYMQRLFDTERAKLNAGQREMIAATHKAAELALERSKLVFRGQPGLWPSVPEIKSLEEIMILHGGEGVAWLKQTFETWEQDTLERIGQAVGQG